MQRSALVHYVDLGESFQTHIFLQNLASIQPRTSPPKFARSISTARKTSSSGQLQLPPSIISPVAHFAGSKTNERVLPEFIREYINYDEWWCIYSAMILELSSTTMRFVRFSKCRRGAFLIAKAGGYMLPFLFFFPFFLGEEALLRHKKCLRTLDDERPQKENTFTSLMRTDHTFCNNFWIRKSCK